MKGGWALIRLRDRDEGRRRNPRHNWLLIKETDAEARPGEPEALASELTSVKTGRTLEEIASRSRNVWHSNRAEKIAATKPKPRAAAARPKAPAKGKAPAKAKAIAKPASKKKLRKR